MVLCFLINVLLAAPGQSASESAVRLNGEGLELARKGLSGEAMKKFRAAGQLDPQYADPYSNLGVLLRQQRDFSGSLEALETARRLSPHDARIQSNLAKTLHDAGRLDDALVTIEAAVNLEPRNATLRRNLAAM